MLLFLPSCVMNFKKSTESEIYIQNLKILAVEKNINRFNNTIYFTFETNIDIEQHAKELKMPNIRLDGINIGQTHSKLGKITAYVYTSEIASYKLPHNLHKPTKIPKILKYNTYEYTAYFSPGTENLNSYVNEIKSNNGLTFSLAYVGQFTKKLYGNGFLAIRLDQLGNE
jgi:hypothetical protein